MREASLNLRSLSGAKGHTYSSFRAEHWASSRAAKRPKSDTNSQALHISLFLLFSLCLILRLHIKPTMLTGRHIPCIWSRVYQSCLEGQSNEHLRLDLRCVTSTMFVFAAMHVHRQCLNLRCSTTEPLDTGKNQLSIFSCPCVPAGAVYNHTSALLGCCRCPAQPRPMTLQAFRWVFSCTLTHPFRLIMSSFTHFHRCCSNDRTSTL